VADGIRITRSLELPPRELTFRFSRSGGPGGQNVNVRDTRVEVVFDVAGSPSLGPRQRARLLDKLGSRLDSGGRLHVVSSDERSQARNRELAVERLRDVLADALRPDPPKRRKTRPSAASRERRLREKKARSRTKRERTWKPEE